MAAQFLLFNAKANTCNLKTEFTSYLEVEKQDSGLQNTTNPTISTSENC